MTAPTLAHRLEWLAMQGVTAWIRQGDLAAATARAQRLGRLGRRLLRSEWRWANANLELVYGPHLAPEQRQRLAGLAFENIFTSYMEALRGDETVTLVTEEARTRLQECYQGERGVVVVSIHLGCWETGLRQLPRLGYPAAVVYRHANNPLTDREINASRNAYGVTLIRRADPRGTLLALRNRQFLVLMTDINTRQGGVTAPFLGAAAQCPPGPARLAMRFGCPVLPIVTVRTGPGRASSLVGPALAPPAADGDEAMVASFTARINACFDDWVHQYAEQYNWLHARWRARPDGSLWRHPLPAGALAAARVAPYAPVSARIAGLLR